jgi:hypothetical protein
MRLSELGVSPAALACLEAAGITDVEHLTTHTATELTDSGHFGPTELYEIVCRLNAHDRSLPPIHGGHDRVPSARNREMLRLRIIEGLTLAEIGKRTGVSTERVRQLLRVYFGLRGTRPRFDRR